MKIQITESSKQHSFEINTDEKGFHKIPVSGKSSAGTEIRFSIPLVETAYYWSADNMCPDSKLRWNISFVSAVNRNFPFICFFDRRGVNTFTIGLNELCGNIKISAQMNQEKATYDLTFIFLDQNFSVEPQIYVNTEKVYWTATLRDYCSILLKDKKFHYPQSAWDPVYCTWYAVHADFTDKWIEKAAEKAAETGFGTFIMDDGWCVEALKKVSPDTLLTWYDEVGRWGFSNNKFTDVKKHVDNVRKHGLKYVLWVGPYMCGVKVKRFDKFAPDAYMKRPVQEGYRLLNIANEGIRKELLGALSELMDLGFDGLKLDFLDEISKYEDFVEGEKIKTFMEAMYSEITKNNPEALIEYRQKYCTPATMGMATQFRAGDVPFDYMENLNRTLSIRAVMGDGVPVHADPAYWSFDDSADTASMHMLCAMAGVPMVSMDLHKISEEHMRIIRHWLVFYKAHIETFRKGHWELRTTYGGFDFASVTFGGETIVYLLSEDSTKYLKDIKGKVYALNLSPQTLNLKTTEVYDYNGTKLNCSSIPAACCGILKSETF